MTGTAARTRRLFRGRGARCARTAEKHHTEQPHRGQRSQADRQRAQRGDAQDQQLQTKAADPALYAELKAWRTATARKRSVPAYVVLHDSTIDGIAAVRPASLAELRGIAGIGDKKLEHYGVELMEVINAHRAEA